MWKAADLLRVIKRREKALLKRIEAERGEIRKLKHKSRRVRQASPLHNRIGWFTDRVQELQLVSILIENKISEEDFIKEWNGDEKDMLVSGISNFLT